MDMDPGNRPWVTVVCRSCRHSCRCSERDIPDDVTIFSKFRWLGVESQVIFLTLTVDLIRNGGIYM